MLSITRIDAIAESMPGGMDGFLKGWGWQQFARAIEAESRQADELLIGQLVDALTGATKHTDTQFAAMYLGRARLLDSDLSKLTERGKDAWAGVDPQKLREGKPI